MKLIPFLLGIAAFGYAGIAISISVENNMRKPSDFGKMISGVFAVVTVVYCGFGLAAYYLYGDSVQAVISCNIANPLGYAVKAALIIQLTVATPLNTYPMWSIIEPAIKVKNGRTKNTFCFDVNENENSGQLWRLSVLGD